MSKSRAIKFILGLLIIVLGLWYFWLKDYNHKITFQVNQPPSVVYDHLKQWNDYNHPKNKVVTILEKEAPNRIVQHFNLQDTLLKIDWNLKQVNDSTTFVTAKIIDRNNPITGNISVINPNSDLYKTNIAKVQRFTESIIEFKKSYKVGNVEEASIPSKFCAYLSLSSFTPSKAKTMAQNIEFAMGYIKKHKFELESHPFLEVTYWDIEKDSIAFDFCFPLKKQDSFPSTTILKFKDTKARKALKTIFNGNYRSSDRAWLRLKDYARFHNIDVIDLPVEFFMNDPHTGTNPLEWSAEVYLPLKE